MLSTTKLSMLVQQQRCTPAFGRWPLKILALALANLTEVFCGSSQSCQAYDGMESSLGHDDLLPIPFQFITHQPTYHQCYMAWNTDTKQLTNKPFCFWNAAHILNKMNASINVS